MRYSILELLIAMTAICIIVGSIAAFGVPAVPVSIILGLPRPFIGNPMAILVVGGLLFLGGVYTSLLRTRVTWPPLIAAAAWVMFALWEWHCMAKGHNIRVDLLLVSPLLFVITLWGVIASIAKLYQSWTKRRDQAANLRSWQRESNR